MIKAVQKGLCELPKANDVRPSRSENNNLTHSIHSNDTEDDNDCVYISPDETENGIFNFPTLKRSIPIDSAHERI